MDALPKTVIVVAGGEQIDPAVADRVPAGALVVAADSGLDHARALGLAVDVVVGDFDSVDPVHLDAAVAAGTTAERHPRDKDAIDLELALDAAVRLGADHVVALGGHGGRLDMAWATGLLLAAPRYESCTVEAFVGAGHVLVVRGGAGWTAMEGTQGAYVSLLPVHGDALGVRTEGLRFPLHTENLPAGTTRGISNEMLGTRARVAVEKGTLLCVLPGQL